MIPAPGLVVARLVYGNMLVSKMSLSGDSGDCIKIIIYSYSAPDAPLR